MTKDEWMSRLDKLIALRGKGTLFDDLHQTTCMEAARIDFYFLTLIMSGEFEAARKWLRDRQDVPES